MKANDIKVGGLYRALVNGVVTVVRVTEIITDTSYVGKPQKVVRYNVTNTKTGRKTVFRSAAKFREPVDTNDALVAAGTKMVQQAKVDAATLAGKTSTISAFAAAMKAETFARPVDTAPHVVVDAKAGTGKTTTCIEGIKNLLGLPTKITPSAQQAAVWDAINLSRGKVNRIGMVAFNSSIAAELKGKVPAGAEAMTAHSLGYKAVRNAFRLLPGDRAINKWRVDDITADLLGKDGRDLKREQPLLVSAVTKLVGLCKMNLLGSVSSERSAAARLLETSVETVEQMPGYVVSDRLRDGGFDQYADSVLLEIGTYSGAWDDALDALASHYDVELVSEDGRHNVKEAAFKLVPEVLERCKDVQRDGCIDFNDMVWLPIALNLPTANYDLLFVDECQDLNRCTQELVCRSGKRLVFVGDENQAIYGFAGADAESFANLRKRLEATDRGVVVLPLTETRRCGKAIVAEANKIVPNFQAHESNGEGFIYRYNYKPFKDGETPMWRGKVEAGDMLLCRVNAPLVSECFKFIKAGKKANIMGRDVGQGLKALVTKCAGGNVACKVPELIKALETWVHLETEKEQARKRPNEAKIIGLDDKYTCILCFTEGCETAAQVLGKIEQVFTDDRVVPGIRLSSIHKAKGLEADRVFLLEPERATVPHPMAKSEWQVGQEWNLRYVAITRAIRELVFVG